MINVLMVDDERVILDLTKTYLEKQGNISVDCVSSVSSGMIKLQSLKYDAIICDYEMNDIDGISFLKAIRGIYPGVESLCPDIPFIVFTGKGSECVVIEALNSGADYYLQKGCDPKNQLTELAHRIEDLVYQKGHRGKTNTAFENTGISGAITGEAAIIGTNRLMEDKQGILSDSQKNLN